MVHVVHKLPKKHKLLILTCISVMLIIALWPSEKATASRDSDKKALEVGKRYELPVKVSENEEQLDVFAYQLPENFNSESTYPLLIAFHQWGGDHMSTFSTAFDEEANQRNWIFLSSFGGSSNNYNH